MLDRCPPISIHDLAAAELWWRCRKLDPGMLRRLRNALCKSHRSDEAVLAEVPQAYREEFADEIELHALSLARRVDSALDGASKLVFRTRDERLLETVILRLASGRTALCVSTQIGCAARCGFCATGQMGLIRNLTAAEILDQVVAANQMLTAERRRVRNLVFMGMGEPFHNENELYQAIDVLADRAVFDFNLNRVMVSTVGVAPAMIRCARRYPDIRLAMSLHSARPEVRSRLMPLAARTSLAELRAALEEVVSLQGHLVMIEYLLLAGVNDTSHDAAALVEYLEGLTVHVNLIPFNPIAGAGALTGSGPQQRKAFARIVKDAGFPVTTRYSLGADIAAACGQLVRDEGANFVRGKSRAIL